MGKTFKHIKAQKQRQSVEKYPGTICDPEFDGRRYGNKRKAIATLKVKDRRRRNRKTRRELLDYDLPRSESTKHNME